jgi:hypothetical protein
VKKITSLLCVAAIILLFSCTGTGKVKEKPVMIANVPPFSIGSVKTNTEKLITGQLKETEVNVVFHPRVNEVALELKTDLLTYRLFWKQEARQGFIDALSRYQEEFAEKKLITNTNKTRSIYGKHNIRLEWEAFSFSKTNSATPIIELGYRFKGNAVYFTSYQNAAKTETAISDKTNDSPSFTIYFNRVQAEKLAQLFDQAYLVELVGGSIEESVPPGLPNPDIDIYQP